MKMCLFLGEVTSLLRLSALTRKCVCKYRPETIGPFCSGLNVLHWWRSSQVNLWPWLRLLILSYIFSIAIFLLSKHSFIVDFESHPAPLNDSWAILTTHGTTGVLRLLAYINVCINSLRPAHICLSKLYLHRFREGLIARPVQLRLLLAYL